MNSAHTHVTLTNLSEHDDIVLDATAFTVVQARRSWRNERHAANMPGAKPTETELQFLSRRDRPASEALLRETLGKALEFGIDPKIAIPATA